MLNVIDEFTRECLAIRVGRKLKAVDVIDVLSDLFIRREVPGHIRSDNGPEFIAQAVRDWIGAVGATTAYIEPGSPWENGYCESFNAKLRDELLNGEIFYTLKEAQTVIESWRRHYNTVRPHSSLGYKPPAPEVVLWPAAQPRPAPPAAARAHQVAHRVDHLPELHLARPTTATRFGHERRNPLPFLIRQIGRITLRLSGDPGHPAPLLWCPHPELESQPALDRNPLRAISQTGS